MPDWALDGRRRCFATNGYLSRSLGVCVRTIQRWKRLLVEGGWLAADGRVGKADCYVLTADCGDESSFLPHFDPRGSEADVTQSVNTHPSGPSEPSLRARSRQWSGSMADLIARLCDPYTPRRGRVPRELWRAVEGWHRRAVGPLTYARGRVLSRLLERTARRFDDVDAGDWQIAVDWAEEGHDRFGTCEQAVEHVEQEIAALGYASLADRREELRERIARLRRIADQFRQPTTEGTGGGPS